MKNNGRLLKILFAEDSAQDVELAIRALKRSGISAIATRECTEVAFRDALISALPDIIISDSSMPQFSSKLALAAARELAPTVPFIVLSGSVAKAMAGVDHLHQVTACLAKSDMEQLGNVVAQALSRATPQIAGDRSSATTQVSGFLSLEIRIAQTYLNQAERRPRGEALDRNIARVRRVVALIDRTLSRIDTAAPEANEMRQARDELTTRLTALSS
jgi:DNA-binding NtrC family response regulator